MVKLSKLRIVGTLLLAAILVISSLSIAVAAGRSITITSKNAKLFKKVSDKPAPLAVHLPSGAVGKLSAPRIRPKVVWRPYDVNAALAALNKKLANLKPAQTKVIADTKATIRSLTVAQDKAARFAGAFGSGTTPPPPTPTPAPTNTPIKPTATPIVYPTWAPDPTDTPDPTVTPATREELVIDLSPKPLIVIFAEDDIKVTASMTGGESPYKFKWFMNGLVGLPIPSPIAQFELRDGMTLFPPFYPIVAKVNITTSGNTSVLELQDVNKGHPDIPAGGQIEVFGYDGTGQDEGDSVFFKIVPLPDPF